MTDASDGGNVPAPVDPTKEIIQKLTPTLRPDKRVEAERVIATFVQKLHVGPLPAPEDLAHYEHVCPVPQSGSSQWPSSRPIIGRRWRATT